MWAGWVAVVHNGFAAFSPASQVVHVLKVRQPVANSKLSIAFEFGHFFDQGLEPFSSSSLGSVASSLHVKMMLELCLAIHGPG